MSLNGEEKEDEVPFAQDEEFMDDYAQPRTLREFNVPRAVDVRGAIRLPRIVGQSCLKVF